MAASNLTSAAADLGLGDGDMLRQQLAMSEEERKKKMLRMTQGRPGQYGDMLTGSAAAMLLGPSGMLRG